MTDRRGPAMALAGPSGWRAPALAALAGAWRGPWAGTLRPLAGDAVGPCRRHGACGSRARPARRIVARLRGRLRVFRPDAPLDRGAVPRRCRAPWLDGALRAGAVLPRGSPCSGRRPVGSARGCLRAPLARAAAFAPLLTLAEAARGTVFTGFPWALPGHALIDTPWLFLSGVTGAHGMTLLVTAVAALWALCIILPRAWPVAAGSLALLVLRMSFRPRPRQSRIQRPRSSA